MFHVVNAVVGATHTFKVTGSAGMFADLQVACFSGVKTTTPAYGGSGASNPNSATAGTGIINGIAVNDLLVATLNYATTNTATVDSGLAFADQDPLNGGLSYGGALAWKIAASTTSVTAVFTVGGATTVNAVSSGFLTAGGTPGLVAHVKAHGNATFTTAAINTTGANFCVANLSGSNTPGTLTDNVAVGGTIKHKVVSQ